MKLVQSPLGKLLLQNFAWGVHNRWNGFSPLLHLILLALYFTDSLLYSNCPFLSLCIEFLCFCVHSVVICISINHFDIVLYGCSLIFHVLFEYASFVLFISLSPFPKVLMMLFLLNYVFQGRTPTFSKYNEVRVIQWGCVKCSSFGWFGRAVDIPGDGEHGRSWLWAVLVC